MAIKSSKGDLADEVKRKSFVAGPFFAWWGLPMDIPKLLTFGLIIAFVAAPPSAGLTRNTGLIFVSSERTNSLVIVDPETKRIVKSLKTSRRPRDMHFNTDHTYLY